MRKLIAAINMTLDGFCDHTAVTPTDELTEHYNELLRGADALLYGRNTYQLMEGYWPLIVKKPTGIKAEDDFAILIDNIPKIVYSRTLKKVDWKNSELKKEIVHKEIIELKNQPGKNLFVGSPGLITSFTNLNLIDEYQLCIHPVIAGSGTPLFQNIKGSVTLNLIKTKTLSSGPVVLYYSTAKK